MRRFFLRDASERTYSKVLKRLRQQSPTVRKAWASTTLWTIQEHLEHDDIPAAQEHAVALLAALDSLLDTRA